PAEEGEQEAEHDEAEEHAADAGEIAHDALAETGGLRRLRRPRTQRRPETAALAADLAAELLHGAAEGQDVAGDYGAGVHAHVAAARDHVAADTSPHIHAAADDEDVAGHRAVGSDDQVPEMRAAVGDGDGELVVGHAGEGF